MWDIKKGAGAFDSDDMRGWHLVSSVTKHAAPGTVFAVDESGKPSVLGRLAMKSVSTKTGVDSTKPVHASDTAYHRFLGLLPAAVGTDTSHHMILDILDAEAEAITDEDLHEHFDELRETLEPIYRADHRYFVMRGSITAPSVVVRHGPAKGGAGADVPADRALAFPRKTRVAVQFDEIRATKSSLGSPPQLGLARVDEPLEWAEDTTVPWVTSIVEPIETARTHTFVVGQPVELTSSIGIEANAGELASIGISPEMLDNAVIQLKVMVEGALARSMAGEATPAKSIVSPELHFDSEIPAVFAFQIKAVAPGPVALRVILYLNGRPTLRQDIKLTAVAAPAAVPGPTPVAKLAAAPVGNSTIDARSLMTLPAARLVLELGTYDEDYPIELTVDGRRSGSERPVTPAIPRSDLATKTIGWRNQLVALSNRYGRGEEAELNTAVPDALRAFAQIGVEIHQALFGLPEQRGMEDLRRMADTIAQVHGGAAQRPLMIIAATRLPLPWGIVYDRPLADAGPVDPAGFWGHRFLIERIAPAVLGKVPGRSLRFAGERSAQLVPCVNGHLDDQQHVVAAANQLKFFRELGDCGLSCRSLVKTRAQLGEWLVADQGEGRLVYFFCHASSAKTIDDRFFQSREASDVGTWLDLDADEALRIDIPWLMKTRVRPLDGQPLVFLNACSTAEGDREFQSPFLTQFMREYDARGLIGSDWKMPTVFADAFSRRFLGRFLTPGTSLDQAFVATSDEFMAAGNPFPLIYAIYGRPDIVVSEEQT